MKIHNFLLFKIKDLAISLNVIDMYSVSGLQLLLFVMFILKTRIKTQCNNAITILGTT